MERNKKPFPERDFQYFCEGGFAWGWCQPHNLKAGKDVANEKLVEILKKLFLDWVFTTHNAMICK
jgi:hypothetical protein